MKRYGKATLEKSIENDINVLEKILIDLNKEVKTLDKTSREFFINREAFKNYSHILKTQHERLRTKRNK